MKSSAVGCDRKNETSVSITDWEMLEYLNDIWYKEEMCFVQLVGYLSCVD
jgi:hypothetical protein